MEITLRSTDRIVEVNGVKVRVWEGRSAGGSDCLALIARVAVPEGQDSTEFERELQETPAPSALGAGIPLRMIL